MINICFARTGSWLPEGGKMNTGFDLRYVTREETGLSQSTQPASISVKHKSVASEVTGRPNKLLTAVFQKVQSIV